MDKISGFDEIQFKEEKIKAHLILKQNKWDELLYSVEKHGYFKGQIGFILFLSGIEEYFNTNSHCDWSEQEDIDFKEQFIKYRDIAIKLFSDKGINLFPDFVWERALLAKGDYLITEGSNQSFLTISTVILAGSDFEKRKTMYYIATSSSKYLISLMQTI